MNSEYHTRQFADGVLGWIGLGVDAVQTGFKQLLLFGFTPKNRQREKSLSNVTVTNYTDKSGKSYKAVIHRCWIKQSNNRLQVLPSIEVADLDAALDWINANHKDIRNGYGMVG